MGFNDIRTRLNTDVESHLYDDDVVANSESFKGMLTQEYVETAKFSGYAPILRINDTHKANITINATITVNGDSYIIREKRSERDGTTPYLLEES